MIKPGVAFVYHQYNDKSLNYESELSKKKQDFVKKWFEIQSGVL